MNQDTPRSLRWTIRLLTLVLFVLFLWLEGFVVSDLDRRPGPDRAKTIAMVVDAQVRDRAQALRGEIGGLQRETARLEQVKANRLETRDAANQTLNQFASQHRVELERGGEVSPQLTAALDGARASFLAASGAFEEANARIGEIQQQVHGLQLELSEVQEVLAGQEREGGWYWQREQERHRFLIACLKLAFVVPLFLLAAWLSAKRRGSLIQPVHRALLVASFLWIGMVMHQHFPKEFFKYIAIGVAIAIVAAFLVHALRNAARPHDDVLLRRRREAYQGGRCPECAYPMPEETGEAMSCAACGTTLFHRCEVCGEVRHGLLPHCRSCGAETELWRGKEREPEGAPA
jgi:heme exporter protein D